ncbi:hypothetical protein H4Q26_010031 [Puccinia striiformis f. sp. tritici PST-130]|nr:hypothetical protein H4Q26_010031 [Puccinia striiformis f. sp. tritici PST-130]
MSSSLNNPTNEELFYEDLGPGFIQVINLPPETTLRNLKLEAGIFGMSDTGPDLHFKYLFNPWYPLRMGWPDLGFRQNFHIQFDERVLAANEAVEPKSYSIN